jgi:hypothetical protein
MVYQRQIKARLELKIYWCFKSKIVINFLLHLCKAGPKTSVLFLQKLNEEKLNKLKKENYPIFMAVVERIGYDLNSKTPKVMFKKDERGEILKNEHGEPIIDTDIPEIISAFKEFKRKYSLDF